MSLERPHIRYRSLSISVLNLPTKDSYFQKMAAYSEEFKIWKPLCPDPDFSKYKKGAGMKSIPLNKPMPGGRQSGCFMKSTGKQVKPPSVERPSSGVLFPSSRAYHPPPETNFAFRRSDNSYNGKPCVNTWRSAAEIPNARIPGNFKNYVLRLCYYAKVGFFFL